MDVQTTFCLCFLATLLSILVPTKSTGTGSVPIPFRNTVEFTTKICMSMILCFIYLLFVITY